MSISAASSGSAIAFPETYSVAVAKKALDAKQVDGKNALTLIESATAPPVKPGHSLSVIA